MHGWPEEEADRTPSCLQLLEYVHEASYEDPTRALDRVTRLIPRLDQGDDDELLLVALWGKVVLQRASGAPPEDVETTCDVLEQVAQDGADAWGALAVALRSVARLDAGDVGGAMAQLVRVELDQLADDLTRPGGIQLLDVLAMAYSRLRLHDQVDVVRARVEEILPDRPPLERAVHWAHAATELALRAVEPLAAGGDGPDLRVLGQAVDVATRLSTIAPDLVPDRLRRGADGIRALAAAYRDRPEEALRLLGEDAFDQPEDLPGLERQLTTLAAIHAHVLLGGMSIARALDDGAGAPPSSLTHLVLEVCRARERLALESRDGSDDAVQVITRLSRLLGELAWQGMGLMAGAARQALDHQALRVERRTDALTGLGNRRALDEDLRNMLRFSPLPQSLVLVDIDEFKAVNDTFTHAIGDEVLRRVAGALGRLLRTGDRLMRYGGDEFVVLLPLTSDTEAEAAAARMAAAIAGTGWDELAAGLSVVVTTGSGTLWTLSHRRPDGDAEQLFRQADEHLLEAKKRRGAGTASAGGRRRRSTGSEQPASGPSGAEPTAAPLPDAPPPAPGSSAPGSSAPGSSAPGSSAPGSSAPGSSAPGSSAPGSSASASSVPGSSAPDAQAAPVQPPAPAPKAGRAPLPGPATAAPEAPARPAAPARGPAASPPAAPPAARAPRRTLDPLRDPLPEGALDGPLSPAFGLPLYRALVQNPPRVDPYLGLLPPAEPEDREPPPPLGLMPPVPETEPARRPEPAPESAAAPAGAVPADSGTNGARLNGSGRHGSVAKGAERVRSDRQRPERNGTERNGTQRNGTQRNGTERNGTERNGTERNGTERNGTLIPPGPGAARSANGIKGSPLGLSSPSRGPNGTSLGASDSHPGTNGSCPASGGLHPGANGTYASPPRPSRQSTSADVRAGRDRAMRARAARADDRRDRPDPMDGDDETDPPTLPEPLPPGAEPSPRPARPRRRPPVIDLSRGDDDRRRPFG